MKVIYCGNGETITPWTAGMIHLQRLPQDSVPSFKEMAIKAPQDSTDECGIPVFLGTDCYQRQVYYLDLGNAGNLAYLTIAGMIAGSDEPWSFRDLSQLGDNQIRCGGILRRFGMTKAARILIIKGIQHSYFRLARMVLESAEQPDIKGWVQFKQT